MRGQRHAPADFYPRKRPGTHCTGGWVGPRAGLDRWGKSRPHRDSITGQSSPLPVAIPTELPGPQSGEIPIPNFHSFKLSEFSFWSPSWDPIIWQRDILPVLISRVGRDSPVGIATRYGLDSPGIESRWEGVGAKFSAPVQTVPGAHPVSYTMGTGSFPGIKRPGCDVDHPSPSSTEVKERVELYLNSPSGSLWPLLGWNLLLLILRFKFNQTLVQNVNSCRQSETKHLKD